MYGTIALWSSHSRFRNVEYDCCHILRNAEDLLASITPLFKRPGSGIPIPLWCCNHVAGRRIAILKHQGPDISRHALREFPDERCRIGAVLAQPRSHRSRVGVIRIISRTMEYVPAILSHQNFFCCSGTGSCLDGAGGEPWQNQANGWTWKGHLGHISRHSERC